uniref:DUF445 family protein n=1 Tax=Mitsuokella multacida TaxID=52226 RepID=UPI004026F01D
MQKKNKANLALGISAAGFVGTLAAGGSGFAAGLFHHGFLAATIGGLADWFAVTALFRKPLGISYRTDVLRRNRKRIMDAIVTFASDDLLSTENIMRVIRDQDTAGLLVDYLEHRGGREGVVEVVDAVVLKIVNDLDSEGLARELAPAVREGLQGLALENILIELVRMLGEERHAKRILHSVLSISEQVLQSPAMQQVLLDNIKVLRKEYEGESAGRAFVLSALGLDDKELLAIFNEKAKQGIKDLLSEQTEGYARLKAGFEGMVLSFSNDASLRGVLGEWKERWLEQMDLEGLIASWIENTLKGEAPFWLPNLNAFVEQRIDGFVHSENWQHRFDRMLKDLIESELTKHHELIPGLIRERLDEFSDDALVTFVEDKVQDDLQMIRINGSIVGSLVGMGLDVLDCAGERMC